MYVNQLDVAFGDFDLLLTLGFSYLIMTDFRLKLSNFY